jgi:pantoate--beta-alanine ligase
MELHATPGSMRAWSASRHAAGRTIGFVPTMGALHAGHLSLVSIARQRCDDVVVSIFVNPLQFDQPADFDAYPRPIDDDVARCAEIGVDAVYAPTAAVMYPAGFETHVEPGPLADVMEGAARPGHFRGVTTVVTKLFAAVRPDVAVFGEKDFQQLAIIRRMTADLDLGIEITGAPIVRETDGLAMSSRNLRLSPADRAAAACIPRALDAVAGAATPGADVAELTAVARAVVDAEPRAELEYIAVFDPATLEPLVRVDGRARAAIAVGFGDIRLIDNRPLA